MTFDSLAYGGGAVARHDGFVLFTKYAAPGERAKVRVSRSKKTWGEAGLVEVLEPSPERVDPPCPLFTTCGGCSFQHLTIEAQRHWKRHIVLDALRPLPNHGDIPVEETVASPDTWRYRNKMEFTFAKPEGGDLVAGFHEPGNWKNILDVEKCWLAPEAADRVLRAAVAEGKRQGLTAWNPRIHEGTFRHLVVRWSVEEQALLAMLLTGDEKMDFPAMAKAMFDADPALKGICWGLNDGKSDVARASRVLDQQGADAFDERLGRYHFQVSLASFFQTNTRGAEKLYQVTMDALQLTGRERLLDAYCGTGTIGIFCSERVAELYGIEIVQEAIWDARSNAARNGIDNATFLAGDMRLTLPVLLNAIEGRIDRLVVDPPRGGMDKKALAQLLDIRAPRLAYVSCNPTTMARDLEAALAAGYVIEKVTPVDMFPQTYHVECVAALSLPPVV